MKRRGKRVEWVEVPEGWDRWDYTAAGVGVAGVAAVVMWHMGLSFWGCSFRWLTGWPCLTCGLTRATLSLAGGHWGQAFHYSPLGAFLEVVLVGIAIWGVLSRLLGWKRPHIWLLRRERWCLWGVGLLLLLLNYVQVVSYHRPWEVDAAAPVAPLVKLAERLGGFMR